jgi:hypothetical protein
MANFADVGTRTDITRERAGNRVSRFSKGTLPAKQTLYTNLRKPNPPVAARQDVTFYRLSNL